MAEQASAQLATRIADRYGAGDHAVDKLFRVGRQIFFANPRQVVTQGAEVGEGVAPMATPNCSTYGRSNCSRQDRVDYDDSGLMAMRAAASLRR